MKRLNYLQQWHRFLMAHRLVSFAVLILVVLSSLAGSMIASHARVQASSSSVLTVDSQANIFGSGHSTPPDPAGGGAGALPPSISFPAESNQVLTFSSVTGQVTCQGGDAFNGPDGGSCGGGSTSISSYGGISGITDNQSTMFLVGVFLDDTEPQDPAPPSLDFSGQNFKTLTPQLNQILFIGDGLTGTGSGTTQQFLVPSTATRLFLGFADTYGFHGAPGAYGDNAGQLSATFQITPISDIVRDGGFEKPIVNNNSLGFEEYSAGQSFGAWTVASGSIDLIRTYWVSAHGAQSVDLDGSNAGIIYQHLSTLSGASYSLSFAMAGNPACAPTVKQMQVWWGFTLVATLSFDTTGHSTTNMGWRYHTYKVRARRAVTRLSFVSLTQSACGPALDSVTVKG